MRTTRTIVAAVLTIAPIPALAAEAPPHARAIMPEAAGGACPRASKHARSHYRHHQDFTLLATEEYAGHKAYKVREQEQGQSPYSEVITWVAPDSFLPLRREFYDVAGSLWKIQSFENITVIDGTPTPLKIRMSDEQQKGSTELIIHEVRYDVALSDDQFDPLRLPAVAHKE